MFQIGALDPRVGNDRRNQLLQKLMQQFMQQQGMGTPGQPAMPTNLMHSTPSVAGTATRPAAVSKVGGRPEFTFPSFIPPGLLPSLGPGSIGRAPQSAMSPMAGIPVPGIGHGGGIPTNVPAGAPIGPAPVGPGGGSQGNPGSGMGSVGTAPVTAGAASAGSIPALAGTPSSGGFLSANGISAQLGLSNAMAQASVRQPGFANAQGAVHTTPSGSIPLGNGVFLNPDGTLSGGGTTVPTGGNVRALPGMPWAM